MKKREIEVGKTYVRKSIRRKVIDIANNGGITWVAYKTADNQIRNTSLANFARWAEDVVVEFSIGRDVKQVG